MKKYFSIILLATALLTAVNVKAQTQNVKSYLAIFGGLSFAQGEFAKTDYADNKAGFGKRGATFGLDGAVYVYKNLAIGATITWQDQGELNNTDANNLAVGYTSSYLSNGTTVTAVNRYHSYNLLLGPQYSFQIHKFIIDIRASAGVLKSTSTPQIDIFLADVPGQADSFTQETAKGKAFAYSGNLGVRYAFSEKWFFAIKGTYINSQGINISTTGRTLDKGRLVTKQPFSELQTTLGIVHSF